MSGWQPEEACVGSAMSESDVLGLLKSAVAEAGSAAAWARQHDVSVTYVHDVITGRRSPGGSILTALGLSKIVTFAPVGDR